MMLPFKFILSSCHPFVYSTSRSAFSSRRTITINTTTPIDPSRMRLKDESVAAESIGVGVGVDVAVSVGSIVNVGDGEEVGVAEDVGEGVNVDVEVSVGVG